MEIVPVQFNEIHSAWEQLTQLSSTVGFFQTYDFHRIWIKHFGNGLDFHILSIKEGSGIIAIAPLVLHGSILQFIVTQPVLGKELVSDYGDILTKEGKEKEVCEVIASYVQENTYQLKLDFVRESSANYKLLTANSLLHSTENIDVAPFLKLPASWDEYLTNLPRHDRHELRRKIKKLPEVHLAFVEPTTENLSILFDLMRQSDRDKVRFLTPSMGAFFTELITFFHTKHIAQLVFLYDKENQPIAAVVGFMYHNRWYLYNSGYRADLRHLSPGVVLKGLLIKDAIKKGIEIFDFLRGSERYKYNLGGVDEKLYQIKYE